MILSILLSRSQRPYLKQSGVTLATFLALCLLGLVAREPLTRGLPPVSAVESLPIPEGKYLATFRVVIDEALHYYNWHHIIDNSRNKILFLGNSRMLFGIRQNALEALKAQTGLDCYMMAFGYGEREVLPLAIIRKYDLHPPWVVINADPFFGGEASPFAAKMMAGGEFEAFKIITQTRISFVAQRFIHRVIPYLCPNPPRADFGVQFRDFQDGSHFTGYSRTASPQPILPGTWGSVVTEEGLLEAGKTIKELRARGTRILMITIPPSVPDFAREVSKRYQVPLIELDLQGLTTTDGSHLDDPTAERFGRAFVEASTPYFQGREK